MSNKLHPLHTPTWVSNYVISVGQYPGSRCTGRTTAKALELIVDAMHSPGKQLRTNDHEDDHDGARPGAHLSEHRAREVRIKCQEFVDKLGLKHFKFTATTIQFGD